MPISVPLLQRVRLDQRGPFQHHDLARGGGHIGPDACIKAAPGRANRLFRIYPGAPGHHRKALAIQRRQHFKLSAIRCRHQRPVDQMQCGWNIGVPQLRDSRVVQYVCSCHPGLLAFAKGAIPASPERKDRHVRKKC